MCEDTNVKKNKGVDVIVKLSEAEVKGRLFDGFTRSNVANVSQFV